MIFNKLMMIYSSYIILMGGYSVSKLGISNMTLLFSQVRPLAYQSYAHNHLFDYYSKYPNVAFQFIIAAVLDRVLDSSLDASVQFLSTIESSTERKCLKKALNRSKPFVKSAVPIVSRIECIES
jgi:hypothetical protein